jgi:hypothetical protein
VPVRLIKILAAYPYSGHPREISVPEEVDRCHRTRPVLRTGKDLVRNILDIKKPGPGPRGVGPPPGKGIREVLCGSWQFCSSGSKANLGAKPSDHRTF